MLPTLVNGRLVYQKHHNNNRPRAIRISPFGPFVCKSLNTAPIRLCSSLYAPQRPRLLTCEYIDELFSSCAPTNHLHFAPNPISMCAESKLYWPTVSTRPPLVSFPNPVPH